MDPFMSNLQTNKIISYLSENDIMLEYGSGGSTSIFSKYVKHYYSVEHDSEWYNKVHEDILNNKNITHILCKPNYTGDDKGSLHARENLSNDNVERIKLLYPYSEENNDYSCIGRFSQFENYVNSIDSFNVEKFDKVLVDGRSRTICCYKILPYLTNESIIFIDDFYRLSYSGRTRGIVEFGEQFFDVYEKVEQVDKMLVARKK